MIVEGFPITRELRMVFEAYAGTPLIGLAVLDDGILVQYEDGTQKMFVSVDGPPVANDNQRVH